MKKGIAMFVTGLCMLCVQVIATLLLMLCLLLNIMPTAPWYQTLIYVAGMAGIINALTTYELRIHDRVTAHFFERSEPKR